MTGRIKVVHLITLLEFGGAQGNTIHTVQNLDPKKFDAYLWSGRGAYLDTHASEKIRPDRIRYFPLLVRPLNPILDLIALVQLWFALRRLKPEILHTHSSKAGILGRIAGWLAGVPVVIHTFHGFGFNDQQMWLTRRHFIFLEKLTAKLAHKLIFVSHANKQTAIELGIGRPEQYLVIRSGVHLRHLNDLSKQLDIRREFQLPSSSEIVTTVGAFKPQKNLKDFLAAAKIVKDQFPNTIFFIVGDGEMRQELENERDRLGLSGSVHMPGWRHEVPSFLAASSVFVMTSLWEGLPRALVEAMSLGVPPVCYGTDGVRDLLDKDPEGLVKQGDVQTLAAKVLAYLADPKRRAVVSNRVKANIGAEFDIDLMVRRLEEVYRDLTVDNPRLIH